jgi:NAD(P)-dependent dehydrogenase (short-subunit alcohol dehydrogenase family)
VIFGRRRLPFSLHVLFRARRAADDSFESTKRPARYVEAILTLVDLGLQGRRAVIKEDDSLGEACARLLSAEGVAILDRNDAPEADIVVAWGTHRPESRLMDIGSAAELHVTWDAVVSAVEVYREALARMREQRWGRFVWVGSAAAKSLDADGDEVDVIASLGMMGLHKVIAAEEGPFQVTANTVLRGEEAADDDVAAAVVFFCSEGAAYLSGVTITVDGGQSSAIF